MNSLKIVETQNYLEKIKINYTNIIWHMSLLIYLKVPKWAFAPFAKTFQQNAPCLKLFRDMLLF